MASLSLRHIYKIYPGDVTAVSDFNLEIEDKEFIVLVGPSGCGKSTTLRMVAGLEDISKGELYIDDKLVNNVPPKDRDIAMVFQSYALYPHMTVYNNMAFGLKLRKMPKDEIDRRVKEAAQILGIEKLLNRKPAALSGGQRQRVALGRAIVREPKVFLMDEPLSNLDAKLRVSMRTELIELHNRLKTTFVYVTHDQTEAMSMGTKIILMSGGVIQQEATPSQIYHDPCNLFTAQFIGSPQMNVLPFEDSATRYGFRPEKVHLTQEPGAYFYTRRGTIVTKEMLGSETIYQIRYDGHSIMAKSLEDTFEQGSEVYIGVKRPNILLFDENERRIRQDDPSYDSWMQKL